MRDRMVSVEYEAANSVANAAKPDIWGQTRHRLETIGAALADGFKPTPEKRKEIFKARANALAYEPPAQDAAGSTMQVIEFIVAQERYAIDSDLVREVSGLKELTPLPCVPPFVPGIINVRGRIVSVIDIKKFFDLPDRGIADLHKVIIAGNAEMELGLLADDVSTVRTVRLSELQPSLPTLTGIRADYLRGITPDHVVILDILKILSDPRMIVREEVEA